MMLKAGRRGVSFAGRLIFILMLALFAAIVVMTAVNFWTREKAFERGPLLPWRIAAIVSLLEDAEPADAERILQAANSPELRVRLSDTPLETSETEPRLPAVEWRVAQQMEAPGKHDVRAAFRSVYSDSAIGRWLDSKSPASSSPLEISVSLTSGGYVEFITRGSAARRIFGVPPGFALGLIGSIMALLAIWAIMREVRPLRQLEKAVNAFATDASPQPIKPQGASDLRNLTKSFNAMQARIAELVEGRTLLLGAISHDIRTYLTRLRLRIESHPDETMRARAVRDLDQMSDLLDNALTLAKGGDGRQVNATTDVVATLQRELADRHTPQISFTHDTRVSLVRLDETSLKRLVNNLINNAMRFGTRVTVRVEDGDAGFLSILIDDNGPGIPEGKRSQVFEPFYTLDPSRSHETGGSGLGLAIAKQIAVSSGGTISIEDSPLGGARMHVKLPKLS
jgi:two-component system, OmpR family, osmolarity sensor histidine kinase EnvZ